MRAEAQGRRAVWIAMFAAIVAAQHSARAAGSRRAEMRLAYSRDVAADACPDEAALRALVAERLGYDPFVDETASDEILVHVSRTADKSTTVFSGRIEHADRATSQRDKPIELVSKDTDCAELGAALAAAIAIAVDPLSLSRVPAKAERASPPEQGPAPATPAPVVDRPLPEVPTSVIEPRRLEWLVSFGPSASVGVLPHPSPGVRVGASLSVGALEIGTEGRFDPPVRIDSKAGSADVSLVGATVFVCLHHRFVFACPVASVGALRGAGLGFDRTREDNTFYVASGVRIGAELQFGARSRFGARAFMEGQVPLRPTRLEGAGAPLWSTPALGGTVALAVVARFP